ncbi:MAG: hypothetical protein EPN93_01440 [Spirochaetes bacterium]|nr:MAG: hypothetical protein EPN93_01440 [Spirochaetota bacterium]
MKHSNTFSLIQRAATGAVALFFSLGLGLCPIYAAPEKEKTRTAAAADKKPVAAKADTDSKESRENGRDERTRDEKREAAGEELYRFDKPEVDEESYAWVIIKTLFILGILVGGFYYFFRFVTKKAGISMPGGDVAQTLSVVPLGQNKFLQVVDLAGKVLVLGVTDGSINLIMEIKEKDEIDRIRIAGSRAIAATTFSFQEFLTGQIAKILKKTPGGGGGPKGGAKFHFEGQESEVDRLNYLSVQKERLKKLNGSDHE